MTAGYMVRHHEKRKNTGNMQDQCYYQISTNEEYACGAMKFIMPNGLTCRKGFVKWPCPWKISLLSP